MSKLRIIFDANAIIELHQFSLWKSVVCACHAAVTPIIRREVKFYKNELGQKVPIVLSKDVEAQKIQEIPVSLEVFSSIRSVLTDVFLDGIDEGEREAIAFLYSSRKKPDYLFCTADRLAIKCLGVLGLRLMGVSIQELFEKTHIKFNSFGQRTQHHSKQLFAKMLDEGFQEAHMHRKTQAAPNKSFSI